MSILKAIRSHLAARLFLSYLLVIVVGLVVLSSSIQFSIPDSFQRHIFSMRGMMPGMMEGGTTNLRGMPLFINYRAAVNEALTRSLLATSLAAVLASLFVSRRVVAPVRSLTAVSQRIADGHFHERVKVRAGVAGDELDRLAHTFNQMASRLEQTEGMRQQLIGDVAHELRTPLTAIKGSMEGLMDGVLPAEAEIFQQVYREADRLSRLVEDLQELSRVEARAYELNIHPTPIAALFDAVRDRLRHQFDEKGVGLQCDVPAGLPAIMADEDRIGQVLLNLVGNALQYTPPGGKVTLSARRKDQEVIVIVADTGIGIPQEHLPHVFTRFYRVDKSRSRAGGGSGIGLTIAKYLVEAHGGRIWADSQGPGMGSTFTFTLPAVR